MSLNDRKKNFRGHFLTESISPIYLRHVQREGKTLGKTPEIVSRCQLRRSVGGRKVAEEAGGGGSAAAEGGGGGRSTGVVL